MVGKDDRLMYRIRLSIKGPLFEDPFCRLKVGSLKPLGKSGMHRAH